MPTPDQPRHTPAEENAIRDLCSTLLAKLNRFHGSALEDAIKAAIDVIVGKIYEKDIETAESYLRFVIEPHLVALKEHREHPERRVKNPKHSVYL